jgi:GTPase
VIAVRTEAAGNRIRIYKGEAQMNPIVAIVGRPNVGKSTLFNRIAGRRKAIVADEPGVTRDRNYAAVERDGKAFTLIDTGGFEPASKDRMFIQMREQCRLAMEEADIILFVLDGKEGINPADEEIAHILRQQEKPVFYIVNKIDGPKHEEKAYDFYALGMDVLYSVSSEHGYGIEDLMQAVLKAMPASEGEKSEREGTKVTIVGRPNVGKSSLINRFLGYERVIVDDVPGTTRDAIDTLFVIGDRRYVLIDTAGIRRKSRITLKLEKYSVVEVLRSIDRSDVALLLLDATEGVTDQDARIAGFIHEKGKGCVVVVNKWDLIEKDSETVNEFEERIREELKFLSYAPVIFISARTGQRVTRILDLVDRVAEEARKRISTSQLNNRFGEWLEANPPPLHRNRRVNMAYVTQVSAGPPTFVIYTNYPGGIHFSYQRYLINRLRESYGFEGVPIRLLFRKKGRQR